MLAKRRRLDLSQAERTSRAEVERVEHELKEEMIEFGSKKYLKRKPELERRKKSAERILRKYEARERTPAKARIHCWEQMDFFIIKISSGRLRSSDTRTEIDRRILDDKLSPFMSRDWESTAKVKTARLSLGQKCSHVNTWRL
jgi:hypothetical protein